MSRRFLALLLALSVLFCILPTFAEDPDDDDDWFDDDEETGFEEEEEKQDFKTVSGYDTGEMFQFGDFFYQITEDGNGAVLTKYSHNQAELTFPAEVDNGLPVVAIAIGLCAFDPVIESVVIPGTVTTIPNRAFATCPNLKSVILEEGVTDLEMCCFGGCENLESIQFPSTLINIGNFAFAACPKLQEVVFGSELKTIGMQAFFQCDELKKAVIPGGDNVEIGDKAFELCSDEFQISAE